MAYSTSITTIGAGEVGQTTFNIAYTGPGIGYLLRTHIYMYINGALTGGAGGVDADGFTFITDNQVELKTYSPVLDDEIEFRRVMPKTDAYLNLVDGGGLTEANLDDIHLGLLYILHEAWDGFDLTQDNIDEAVAAAAAAGLSEIAAELAETNAETAQAAAELAETNAETAQAAAEAAAADAIAAVERTFTVGGTANAITLTSSGVDPITAYENRQVFLFRATEANSSAVTINIDGVGVVAVNKSAVEGYSGLVRHEIAASAWTEIVYDSSLAAFVLMRSADRKFTLVDLGPIIQGRSWNTDMIGTQSLNPFTQGGTGTAGGTLTAGQTLGLRLQWGAEDITTSYTIQGGDTAADAAAGLEALLLADSTIAAEWWFATPTSSAVMQIQWDASVGSVTITDASAGGPTLTLSSFSTALDSAPWNFFSRSVPGRNAEAGDGIYAQVHQSSDSSQPNISTWYATQTVRIIDPVSATRESIWTVGTADAAAGLSGTRARLSAQKGVFVYEGALAPTGGDKGDGSFNANKVYQKNKGVLSGDASPNRVMRKCVLTVQDGTNASTLKCALSSRWNGDVIASTDNIALGATTGDFTLDGGGTNLKIEPSGLSGNAVAVLSVDIYANASTTPLDVLGIVSSGAISLTGYGASDGVAKAMTTLVDTGNFNIEILYLTDA